MKENFLISLFCCVVLFLVFSNSSTGMSGRLSKPEYNEARIVSEEAFYLQETDENQHQWIQLTKDELNESEKDDALSLYALSACMIDAETGRILYGKNETQERAMASTTKILTCLLALEHCPLDDIVTVSEYAASMPDVQLNAKAGEQFRLYDLLLSLMLESHNDTAVAIAEHVGGTVEDFCKMMTERAHRIGCTNSVFLTPNGLDKEIETEKGVEKHSTTAYELALILKECIKNEQFVAICRTDNAMISNIAKTASYQLHNHNALLNMMQGVIAGKTGFTCDAGYCYVGAVNQNDSVFVCALLGCGWPNHKNYKWYDMNVLIDYAQKEFRRIELPVEQIEKLLPDTIPVIDGMLENNPVDSVRIRRNKMETHEVLMSTNEKLVVSYELPACLSAPINIGDRVGEIRYTINGQTIMSDSLTAMETIQLMTFKEYLRLILQNYMLSDSSKPVSEKCSS